MLSQTLLLSFKERSKEECGKLRFAGEGEGDGYGKEWGNSMERGFQRAKAAIEGLFWDWCVVEEFAEKGTDWGECLHEKEAGGEGFPCRLVEKVAAGGADGLLATAEREAMLLYPTDREIPAGSDVRITLGSGEERLYTAAGESSGFRTHKECGMRRKGRI